MASADLSRPAALPATIKRQRLVGLDTSYLMARIVSPRTGRDAASTPAVNAPLPPIVLTLFPGMTLDVTATATSVSTDGRIIWSGRPEDDPMGQVDLIIDGIQVVGTVRYQDAVVEIRPASFGLHFIIEIDPAGFPNEGVTVRPPEILLPGAAVGAPPASPPMAPVTRAADSSNTTINVLVAYTSRSAAASSNIGSEIQLAVTTANAVYQNSGIPIMLNLVGGPASGYPQAGWWWNADEAGRCYFVEAQNNAIFISFYMYNSSGQATWYVASGYIV
jgi:hypothetical protein